MYQSACMTDMTDQLQAVCAIDRCLNLILTIFDVGLTSSLWTKVTEGIKQHLSFTVVSQR